MFYISVLQKKKVRGRGVKEVFIMTVLAAQNKEQM